MQDPQIRGGQSEDSQLDPLKYIHVIFCSPRRRPFSLGSNPSSATNWLCDLGRPIIQKMVTKVSSSTVILSLYHLMKEWEKIQMLGSNSVSNPILGTPSTFLYH